MRGLPQFPRIFSTLFHNEFMIIHDKSIFYESHDTRHHFEPPSSPITPRSTAVTTTTNTDLDGKTINHHYYMHFEMH